MRMPRLISVFVFVVALSSVSIANGANRLYDKYHASMVSYTIAGLSAPIDVATDTIKIAAVTSSYVPNTATHQFYSSISTSVVGTPIALTHASSTAGVYKSSNNPAIVIPANTTVTYLVIYKDTGTPATSPLMAIIDTGPGLPYTSGSSATTVNITMNPTGGWFKP